MAEKEAPVKAAKRRKRPPEATAERLEAIFLKYCELNGNKSATARAFKIANTTVTRYERQFDWIARREQVEQKVHQRADRKAANQGVQNLRTARAIRNGVAQLIAQKINDKKYDANVGEFVKVSEYVDRLEGVGDESATGSLLIAVFNQLGDPTSGERERLIDGIFEGLDLHDRKARDRISKILHSSLYSQN